MNSIPTKLYTLSGNITLLLGDRPDEIEQDILYSILYSQLLAQKIGNDPESTWSNYVNILGNLSWTVKTRKASRLEFKKSSILKTLQLITEQSGSIYEQEALSKAFDELQNLPTDSPVTQAIIDRLNLNELRTSAAPQETQATALTFTVVRQNNTLLTVQISFETSDVFDTDTWSQSEIRPIKDKKNNIRVLAANFLEEKYSESREAIIKKLGRKIETELFHVQNAIQEN
ncbi:hypothetical protein [Pseudomonas sp. LB3P31]